jgi:DNA-binding transcriptional MerR regulator
VYGISVAAAMVGTGVQNLRAYEKAGLVSPDRTPGGTRLYSGEDIARLHRITELLDAGLNLSGIGMVLDLQDDNARLRAQSERTGRRGVTRGD